MNHYTINIKKQIYAHTLTLLTLTFEDKFVNVFLENLSTYEEEQGRSIFKGCCALIHVYKKPYT